MNILSCCAAFFIVLLLLWMDDKDVGANAVVRVLPMATAVARAAVVDRENFMVLFVQQRSTVFVRDVMSVLERNRVLIIYSFPFIDLLRIC